MRKLQTVGFLGLTLTTLVLAGCGSDENKAPITTAQALSVGALVSAQTNTIAQSFTSTNLSTGSFFSPALAKLMGVSGLGSAPFKSRGPCPSVDDATDVDGDGVADNATYTFTIADCGSPGVFEVSGTVHVTDPNTSNIAVVGYNAGFANFLVKAFGQGSDFASVGLNGTHNVNGAPTAASLSESITIAVDAMANGKQITATANDVWNVGFTPAGQSTIDMGSPLPDGQLDFGGTFSYTVNGQKFSFSISSPTVLNFDSTCGLDWPFSAGEVHAHVTGESANVYIKVVYNGCGTQPTVTFVGRTGA